MEQYNIPVLFLTAKVELASKIKVLRLGAEDCIVKPFEISELLCAYKKILRKQKNGTIFCNRGTSDNWVECTGSEERQPFTNDRVLADDDAYIYRQAFSPVGAVSQCKAYMEAPVVTDILPLRKFDAYIAKDGEQVKVLYQIKFIQAAAGSPPILSL